MVYFSESLNELAARHWSSFSRQQYFDSQGLFISVVFSVPLLLNCMILVVRVSRPSPSLSPFGVYILNTHSHPSMFIITGKLVVPEHAVNGQVEDCPAQGSDAQAKVGGVVVVLVGAGEEGRVREGGETSVICIFVLKLTINRTITISHHLCGRNLHFIVYLLYI